MAPGLPSGGIGDFGRSPFLAASDKQVLVPIKVNGDASDKEQ